MKIQAYPSQNHRIEKRIFKWSVKILAFLLFIILNSNTSSSHTSFLGTVHYIDKCTWPDESSHFWEKLCAYGKYNMKYILSQNCVCGCLRETHYEIYYFAKLCLWLYVCVCLAWGRHMMKFTILQNRVCVYACLPSLREIQTQPPSPWSAIGQRVKQTKGH